MQFEHIQGKKNIIADAISRLRTFGLYQDHDNEDPRPTLDNTIENVIEEIHNIESTSQKFPVYINKHKLNLDLLRKEQLHDKFCKKKVEEIKTKPDPCLILDENSILRNAVKLKYTDEAAIVIPRKLTNIISLEFHNGEGN